MPTVIYPPTIDYNWLYQRPQQLLKEIAAQGYKVVFFNNDRYFKQDRGIIEKYPNFFLCKAGVPLSKIGIDPPVILWISYPPHVSQVGRIYNESLVVFDAIDEASGEFISWAKGLDLIVRKADILFTTSKKLFNYHEKLHNNVHLCPNGADFPHFSKAQKLFSPMPKDLPKNGRPIIGYFGAIAPWIDWELLRYISSRNKDFNFVMIGPTYGKFIIPVKTNNIYYLGRKEYSELPSYLQYFDVCIIPFKITPMIESCNPIKMYEYLSSGKPVVSTNMPEAATLGVVSIGRSKEEFNERINEELRFKRDKDRINARIDVAQNNSWSFRAQDAVRILEETISKKLGT
ncbi:MAG: glycosyltransferase [Clostridia bacterium]|nr:glycosyltransferase [Clostridia bacterium]